MPLTKKRIGEIAIVLLNYRFKEKGIRIAPSERRSLYNVADVIGISREELQNFALKRIGDLLKTTFNLEFKLSQIDPKREGEIAFEYCKYLLKKDEMKFLEMGNGEIEKMSKETKIPFDEISLFFREVGISITEDSFGKER